MRRSTLLVLPAAVLVLAACGGGGTNGHPGVAASRSGSSAASTNPGPGNVAAFCADYTAADQAYQDSLGDVTDPAFTQYVSLLTKAQAEAPPDIAAPVSALLRVARAAQQTKTQGEVNVDLTPIADWANANCTMGGASSPPNATDLPMDSGTPAGQDSGQVGSPSASSDALARFCADVWTVTINIGTMNNDAIEGGSATPSTSDWQAAATAAHNLAAEAPATDVGSSTASGDATAMAGDIDDIVSNGFGTSDGGANLETDNGLVQADATRLGCPAPK